MLAIIETAIICCSICPSGCVSKSAIQVLHFFETFIFSEIFFQKKNIFKQIISFVTLNAFGIFTHTHTLKQEKTTIFMTLVTKTTDMSVLDNFEVLSLFLLTKLVATTKTIVCRLPPSTLPPPTRPYIALFYSFLFWTHTQKSVGKILAILAVFELLMGPKGSRNAGHRNKTNNECNQVCNKLKDTNAFVGQNCWDIFSISIFYDYLVDFLWFKTYWKMKFLAGNLKKRFLCKLCGGKI